MNKKILLIYPKTPNTFWSFKHAIKFISKKALHPPLGLITVAAMLPIQWKKKLIDLNIERLKDKHIEWADYVFISAMEIQNKSVREIITRCERMSVKIVVGGPLFTASYSEYIGCVDHIFLNEAENTIQDFLRDLKNNCTKQIYEAPCFPDIENSPSPLFELLNFKRYASMSIQYSRGCPFACEFCNITTLFGRKVRTKNKTQMLTELKKLYHFGWKGDVFIVDDNFIGNKEKLKKNILPSIIKWANSNSNPFTFSTEASINLSQDNVLMKMMIKAGFTSVFVGIETPDEESLAECNKHQNKNIDLEKSIAKIQQAGLEVTGGFIVGFDNDKESIFQKQIDFIRNTKIVVAMVGLLNAPRDTSLYKRLMKENRLLKNITGNNTDFTINFIPKMDLTTLTNGYKKIINELYTAECYYERVKGFLQTYKNQVCKGTPKITWCYIKAFFKTLFVLGIKDKGRKYYWKLFFWALLKQPRSFPEAIIYAVYGYHFRKVFAV
ncbi:MAG: B12-binding domain-containing radical SAM protein [Gammaproteobacteria bacterium]|jgi:radical SAM superfamily enzyme YgiQ (UPF0313 family)